ncbi:MAG: hypothetical protein HON47_00170 [Candidatus Diapherotrites archaeon]|jgi:hypothetical protein|uniref:DUF5640 domain-containing protein n=1 Tax=Candidatus Iainarchaeum sp. TaxID=3101447 RepID=A0A8T5GDD3_9ARCH|nr:hypothetical protein [Candidatus Diapherotrites archaeon]
MKKIILIACLAVLFLFIGCMNYTPLTDEQMSFAGEWVSSDAQYLKIHANGSGGYEGYLPNSFGSLEINGGTVDITSDKISITFASFGREFVITKPPFEEDGKMKMVLDGITFTKK